MFNCELHSQYVRVIVIKGYKPDSNIFKFSNYVAEEMAWVSQGALANRNTTATTNAILNFPVVTLKTGKKKSKFTLIIYFV